MKVIIIEDELLAQAKLEAMLMSLDRSIEVSAKVNSVEEALRWLSSNPSPDIAFVDIQLSDDHSFEIFRQHPVNFPVIFTTAYDKYLLESFEFNSVDYLLKPITEEKLKRSLNKVKKLEQHFLQGNILKMIEHTSSPVKRRIVAKKGNEFIALELDEVAYFYTEHKLVFVRDFSGRQLIVDKNLADLESTLDKNRFFRLNRKFIAQLKAIERFKPDKGKVRIYLRPEMKEEVHVSKETAPEFRKWIGMKDDE
jgi:DNA-binding LytR/AlgR family response regulator